MAGDRSPEAGWYREPGNESQERLWDGVAWQGWVRPHQPGRHEPNPAGWRPDPSRPGTERLWSGEAWTGLNRPMGGAGPHGEPYPARGEATLLHGQGTVYQDANAPQRLQGLSDWIRFLLVLIIVAEVGQVIARQVYIGYDSDRIGGGHPGYDSIEAAVNAVRLTAGIEAVLYLVVAIVFIVWFFRAYRNLVRGGISDLRHGPGWAIGGWFIPIFSWFRQKAIANDIWKGSAAASSGRLAQWRQIEIPYQLNWWWGLWIAGGLIGFAGRRSVGKAEELLATSAELSDERTFLWVAQAGTVMLIAAAALLYFIVRDVSRMQDGAFAGGVAVPPPEGAMAIDPGTPPAAPGRAAAHDPLAMPATPAALGSSTTAAPSSPPAPAGMKTCPDCAEEVKAAARVCRYCGYRFSAAV